MTREEMDPPVKPADDEEGMAGDEGRKYRGCEEKREGRRMAFG